MKERGMVVPVALALAATATLAVFLYLRGLQEDALTGGDMVSVLVTDRDIIAGTDLDPLISDGAFTESSLPKDAVVDGAATDISELEGRRTSAPILAGEQVPLSRLEGSTGLPGGTLGIPKGYEAVTLPLENPRVAGGALQKGDHVTVYGTFADFGADNRLDATVSLVPDSRVLEVTLAAEGSTSTETMVTLALKPRDAQKTVFAQEQGSVWMALLPPDQKGKHQSAVTQNEVIR
jgi:pilus assembly protein CpaB